MSNLWKLSPSDLTFLWSECRRCFYLKVVQEFKRPAAPFPKIFTRIDRLMQTYFEGKSTAEISPDLAEGVVKFGDKWVKSQPMELPNHDSSCFILGKFDTVVEFADSTFGVVDFKTTEPTPTHVPFYSRQLHAYAYALEHPAPRRFRLSPITTLGLLCVEPTAMDRHREDQVAYIGDVSWLEIPKDEGEFLDFIDQILSVLERSEPPPPGPKCGYCHYLEGARDSGW